MKMVLNGPSLTDFQKSYKNILFLIILRSKKAVSVDSFTKMDAKCLRPGFGRGRAGWAGLGWLGWAALLGWLGCLGCLAGLAGLGWAGPGLCLGLVLLTSGAKARKSSNRASWVWFSRLLEPTPESL